MTRQSSSPLLLFYPTSPVHVRDLRQVIEKLPDWRAVAIAYRPLARVAPGIDRTLCEQGIAFIEVDSEENFEKQKLPNPATLVVGAVFESFALHLIAWAKLRQIPVVAIQEVAQLALNQLDINNYDAPFDRLFVASADEKCRFLSLGYPRELLSVSGLLANDRLGKRHGLDGKLLTKFNLATGKKPIVYTTSPLRGRLSLHNKDDLRFREAVLTQIAVAARRSGRNAIVKLHPNEDVVANRKTIHKIIPDAIVLGREINMDELFSITGILVNRGNSQTCLEAVLRGIPTVVSAGGLKTLFHDDGGAYIVDDLGTLSDTIERGAKQGPIDASRVREKHFFLPPEGVAGYIAKEITELIRDQKPASEKAWNWLIKSMLFVGRHDRALALCKTLQSRSPWQELVHDALKAHSEGRVEDSITCWRSSAALDPLWYFPQYELAHNYQATKQFDKAVEHAHKAIELHPPFHALWHEIPMRVVIMTSRRRMGNLSHAAAELKRIEDRGLVAIVPELLIEKAAQLSLANDGLDEATNCLDAGYQQLVLCPINEHTDRQLIERTARQYLEIAKRYGAVDDRERSLACLKRIVKMASCIQPVVKEVVAQSAELAERSESEGDFGTAENCYNLAGDMDPGDYRARYRLARVTLKQGKLFRTMGALRALINIPDGAKQMIPETLSPPVATRVLQHWPSTPTSILKPIILAAYALAWAVQKNIKSAFHDFFEAATILLMIWAVIGRHFYRRINADLTHAKRAVDTLRSCLFRKSSATYRVANCPICAGPAKFEYRNKFTPLFRCRRCDHVYARDLPDDRALSALYGDFGYWEKDRCHQGITTIQESKGWEPYLKARIGILERLKLLDCPSTRSRSVFEIGCAEGMLLHALEKKGMKASGCEMNRAVALEGMRQLGVQILTEPFEKLELPKNHFDLVMSFHTLEHMRFPVEIFRKAVSILRPEGAILIEVPCGEEEYENTDHLHFFCEKSLRRLIDGFFVTSEILDNSYTNSLGVRMGSIYGFGRGVRKKTA